MKRLYFAGGCFWGTQKFFDQFDGVIKTEVGYANGQGSAPSYEEVCAGSGHAETVRVEFDENILPVETLVEYYFRTIDPTSVNKQGGDVGVQYRTGIYYEDESLLPALKRCFERVESALGCATAVELAPIEAFWPAEEYHQKYLDKNPGGYCHIGAALFNIEKR